MNDTPRRCYIDRLTPAETAIHEAMVAVESLGADVRLTEAVTALATAKSLVADFVDGVETPRVQLHAGGFVTASDVASAVRDAVERSA
jgi:hypothetical protein